MARTQTADVASPYYPPRARWYRGIFHFGFALRRALCLEKIHLPASVSPLQCLLSLIVPGLAFVARGRRVLGWSFLAGYLLAGLIFVASLGFPLATFVLGLVIAGHTIGIFYLELQWLRDSALGSKILCALLTLAVVGLGVYWPALHYAGRHWFMPLRVRGQVVVVQRGAMKHGVQRGDWVMYPVAASHSGDAHGGGAVYVRAGFVYGPVLAMAGDLVEFSTNSFFINGVSQPLRPHMPVAGTIVVPEKHWFVWPELDINTRWNVSEADISGAIMRMAVVPESRFVGRPFKQWFGRRQPFS